MIQTIAPKFTGSFFKGIDYVGDIRQFAREFEDDISVIAFAVKTFNHTENLKLSTHSGSDKVSLYPVMHAAIARHKAGLHLKPAGTTWLEEVIGLAASGNDGLELAKEIYEAAFSRVDELAKPYLPVIQIDRTKLPEPRADATWNAQQFVETLRHIRPLFHRGPRRGDRRDALSVCDRMLARRVQGDRRRHRRLRDIVRRLRIRIPVKFRPEPFACAAV